MNIPCFRFDISRFDFFLRFSHVAHTHLSKMHKIHFNQLARLFAVFLIRGIFRFVTSTPSPHNYEFIDCGIFM